MSLIESFFCRLGMYTLLEASRHTLPRAERRGRDGVPTPARALSSAEGLRLGRTRRRTRFRAPPSAASNFFRLRSNRSVAFVVPDRLDRLERVRPWVRAPPRRGTPPPRRPRTRLTPLRPPGRRRRPRAPRWTRRLVAPSDADLIREISTRLAAPWTGPKIRRSLARVAPRLA